MMIYEATEATKSTFSNSSPDEFQAISLFLENLCSAATYWLL